MSFDLFEKEVRIIERGTTLLESGVIADEEAAKEFKKLHTAYKKLFKMTKRLVKMSDRNEEKLNKLASTLDEKSTMLEGLSGKLAKYLSPQIYQCIFSGAQDVSLNTQRKKLTVYFSDIKNFTQTTEDLQPEDLTFLLNSYFTEMSAIALKHGATIDKFIGDAMLMFFGDPETMGVKEDAQACVRMAMEMQRRMADLKKMWWDKGYEHPFEMRVGINTGYCNVGNFGSEDRMDYTIIGGEVNLAARLEANADPNGILMSYETYSQVKDIVEAEAREPIHVKGIRREVKPYAVTNIFENYEEEQRIVQNEYTGFNLFMNIDELSTEDREKIVGDLAAAIDKLSK
ncbi:adenylate/guanylate cyclase domain-containing protein [Pseudodesulfovibrio sp.]|nr:adenylate/guanylate cyclase domain-containing protein [Pseudodesulfovibrio sp.]